MSEVSCPDCGGVGNCTYACKRNTFTRPTATAPVEAGEVTALKAQMLDFARDFYGIGTPGARAIITLVEHLTAVGSLPAAITAAEQRGAERERGKVEQALIEELAIVMSEFVDNWPEHKKVSTSLALLAKTMRAALDKTREVRRCEHCYGDVRLQCNHAGKCVANAIETGAHDD